MFSNLGFGLGLRPSHYAAILSGEAKVDWFEAVTENYMGIAGGDPGPPLRYLEKIRRDFPIVLHGVSLSIGSTDPLNLDYLKSLKELKNLIRPEWVSDHLCWTGVNGENLHDLLPLPYTEETINHLAGRIQQCQEILGERMVFENVSAYLSFKNSEMTEWEFISEVARRADCGILLDVNNIYVSSINQNFNPHHFINGVPLDRVAHIHLAGHSNMGTHLIDTHDHPVAPEVWDLYRYTVERAGARSTMVEWDANIPDFAEVQAEVFKARAIQESILRKHDEPVFA